MLCQIFYGISTEIVLPGPMWDIWENVNTYWHEIKGNWQRKKISRKYGTEKINHFRDQQIISVHELGARYL